MIKQQLAQLAYDRIGIKGDTVSITGEMWVGANIYELKQGHEGLVFKKISGEEDAWDEYHSWEYMPLSLIHEALDDLLAKDIN